MKYKIVTCFNETQYKQNIHQLLEQFKNNFHPNIEFDCYYYDFKVSNYLPPMAKNIKYINLNTITEFNTFIENNKDHNGTENNSIVYTEILDSLSAFPKVFSLTESAFNSDGCWLIWLDPLSKNIKDIRTSTLDAYFPKQNENIDFISMPEVDYFMAFNINKTTAVDLMGDWRGAYISDEYLNYREWGSSFILSRLVTIYHAHGLKLKETDSFRNLFINLKDKSSINVRDSSGNRVVQLSETETSPDILPGRYRQLADIIRFYKPKTILETGTWNGGRAIEMALASFENTDSIHYIGYDLFEDGTPEIDAEEFNGKAHNTIAAVEKRFNEFKEFIKKEKQKEFTFKLYKGNVRDTLKSDHIKKVDLALIGSGNSIKTVQHEYNILKNIPVVIGDHFFTKDDDDNIPDEKYQGIKKVFDSIPVKKVNAEKTTDDGWTVFDEKATTRKYLLPSSDKVFGGGRTHLVVMLHKTSLKDIPPELKQVPIVVHPRDSVPKEYIANNIKTNMKLIDSDKWVQKHPPHKETGIIISAGPYIDYEELKTFIFNNPKSKVLCVKHAYPGLLENNIKPWGCIVLDPRPITGKSTHNIIRKTLFDNLDEDTNFFVASMTDPSVTSFLKENNSRIWGWHAYTDSLREENERGQQIQNQQVKLNEELGIPQGATLITGGTCAAMRSIGFMHTIGFRDIHLFGFDCCREEPTNEEKTETTGDIDGGETPKPKYIQVNVKEKTYWTTGELLAMAQDCEKVFSDPGLDGILTLHGKDTMVSDLWEIRQKQETRPYFKGYYDA